MTGDAYSHLKLWFTEPARQFFEALPIGNGRLGAMVYGDTAEGVLHVCEETLWSGGPHHNNNPAAAKSLDAVRRLIFEGRVQ